KEEKKSEKDMDLDQPSVQKLKWPWTNLIDLIDETCTVGGVNRKTHFEHCVFRRWRVQIFNDEAKSDSPLLITCDAYGRTLVTAACLAQDLDLLKTLVEKHHADLFLTDFLGFH